LKTKIMGVLAATLLVGALVAPSAQAARAGTIHFAGTASLATFPCDPGPCAGSFSGTASGKISGTDGTTPWTAKAAGANMTANFTYSELVAECPASGDAAGSFTISGGTSHGSYGTSQGTVTRVTGNFTWERTGLAAVISITNVRVVLNVPGAPAEIVAGSGTAAAEFVPVGAPACASPAPLTAAVNGTAFMATP
jgi:hypothetical protein